MLNGEVINYIILADGVVHSLMHKVIRPHFLFLQVKTLCYYEICNTRFGTQVCTIILIYLLVAAGKNLQGEWRIRECCKAFCLRLYVIAPINAQLEPRTCQTVYMHEKFSVMADWAQNGNMLVVNIPILLRVLCDYF